MKVRDVMTVDVVTATPDTPIPRVVDDLIVHGISGMPVVDAERRVVGVVTEADIVAKEAYGPRHRALGVLGGLLRGHNNRWVTKASGLRAGDVMTEPAVTATPEDDLRRAAARMVTLSVKRLPVVDGSGRLVGIVSRRDVMRLFHRADAELALDVQRLLDDPLSVPDDHAVSVEVYDGEVILTGSARCSLDVKLIETMVLDVPGVLDVRNEMTAREPDPAPPKPNPYI
jgi:CBS domain-containing protein